MKLDEVKKLNIPKSPGCYKYFNEKGGIIYIGKAADLRSRVFSYWSASANHSLMKEKMMQEIRSIKLEVCDSEMEALLLEASLIKEHQPHYNILMRDDKRFSYIKVSTEEDWPRVYQTRVLDNAGTFFGPFTSGESVKVVLKVLRQIWPYRSCRVLSKRVCLYYHINKCPGCCEGYVVKKKYKKTIEKIIAFLNGRQRVEISNLKTNIKALLKEGDSDKAAILTNELEKINFLLDQTKLISHMEKFSTDVVELAKILGLKKIPRRIEGYDIAHVFGREIVGSMVVFEDGEPNKNEYRKFRIKNGQGEINDTKMLREVIERRFSNDWAKPDLIMVDGGKGQLNAVNFAVKKCFTKEEAPLVISISKGRGLRSAAAPDRLHFPGEKNALELSLNSPALHVLKRIRDEAHRFAITYHKLLRSRKALKR